MEKKDGFWKCPKCKHKEVGKEKIVVSEKIEKEKIEVLKQGQSNVYPVVSAICPKCGNGKAYYFSTQTRAGDEAETRFFICTKCGYRWREYE